MLGKWYQMIETSPQSKRSHIHETLPVNKYALLLSYTLSVPLTPLLVVSTIPLGLGAK